MVQILEREGRKIGELECSCVRVQEGGLPVGRGGGVGEEEGGEVGPKAGPKEEGGMINIKLL